ncbi:Zinc finger MYM-type protein 1-like [Oopsacas minuta]|uniref:Zinc finger MYM-type protein 1-like n=1 Tax=Oopsacas minuta TaxID=111878 RepID=A0AAV7KIR0_9METZ|nr:Zinc finger MYM-type protein 1-like [Oopsacas minuta]
MAMEFLKRVQLDEPEVDKRLNSISQNLIQENRSKIISIIKTIIFCGTTGCPLRGKTEEKGIFFKLIHFRIDAGDEILRKHIVSGNKNAKYLSSTIQNELINEWGQVIAKGIVSEINSSVGFTVLADETADINGHEQLSVALRFIGQSEARLCIREEFLGFSDLHADLTAESISKSILNFLQYLGINMELLVGQGYDGCSTMAGKVNGVKSIILKRYPSAIFVHCASYFLNLAINDLSRLPTIRNTIDTIKSTIKYFRDSVIRSGVLKLKSLCETRWTGNIKV